MTPDEALLALIDDYAEARHAGGCHTYNVKTNEARKQVAAELRRLHARVTELEAQAVPAALFDAEGFREWETRNMPDDTIIGSSAWWAAMRKPTRTVTYVCPVCAASLERQE